MTISAPLSTTVKNISSIQRQSRANGITHRTGRKADTLEDKRRLYIHLYYNLDKAAEDQKNFDRKLLELRRELLESRRVPEHENLYKKYFEEKTTLVRGTQVTVKEDAVKKAKRYYGL